MYMCTAQNTDPQRKESGSALVVTMIVLAILTVLGLAALDVADVNILISANDRDSKNSFFHADAGANVGHEFLEEALYDESGNGTLFYNKKAESWRNETIHDFNSTEFPLSFYVSGDNGVYVRAGSFGPSNYLEGASTQMGAGYHSKNYFTKNYLIRSHYEGQRNSRSEVDLGWQHVER